MYLYRVKSYFSAHIEKNKLFGKKNKLLVAVSGGKDSMVLTQLLSDNGFDYTVAHCNFCLRGAEANEDELFVKEYFEKKGIPVLIKRFNTAAYADEKNISIQMAARELRYNWFMELCKEHHFDYVLTAHHANDAIETFFINLLRGTGLNGLKGIPEKSEKIVRPLLFATREEIDRYISENAISYREDSSNREEKYLRNKLRHQLIPLLKELNPSLEQTMMREMKILEEAQLLITESLQKKAADWMQSDDFKTQISIPAIKELPYRNLMLHEVLNRFNFNSDTLEQLSASLDEVHSGKQFHSATHTALIDRDQIIIKNISDAREEKEYIIHDLTATSQLPIALSFLVKEEFFVDTDKKIACLDADKVTFPLRLTHWKEGDSFYPLGMQQRKKLSDFFVSEKMSLFEKQEQWILRSGDDIIWIVGRRIDDRFKVMQNTERTLVIRIDK